MSQTPFCVAPFVHMFYKGWDNKVKPCCEGSAELQFKVTDGDDWERVWNHDNYRELRASLLRGQPHSYCTRCVEKEKMGVANHRAQYLKKVERSKLAIDYRIDGGNQHKAPLSFDYRPNNVCNLKCRMCNPTNSTLFAKEALKEGIFNRFDFPDQKKIEALTEESGQELFLQHIPVQRLATIKLLGGEPSLSEDVLKFVESFGERIREMRIEITTNGLQFPKRLYEHLARAESLKINISIDGVAESYEYIRSPAKWSRFQMGFEALTGLMPKFQGAVDVNLNLVLQVYNYFSLPQISSQFENMVHSFPRIQPRVFVNPVDQPWLSCKVIPTTLRDSVIEELESQVTGAGCSEAGAAIARSFLTAISASSPAGQRDRHHFCDYTQALDRARHTRLADLDHRFEKVLVATKGEGIEPQYSC
jgi:sulfatase maturation enzyme AslB (radical SAM superfamily)